MCTETMTSKQRGTGSAPKMDDIVPKDKIRMAANNDLAELQESLTVALRQRIAKYKRKAIKVEDKLRAIEEEKMNEIRRIEEEKEKEIGALRDQLQKIKEAAEVKTREEEERARVKKEAAVIREENKALAQKNEKLKANCKNLRINNMRLEHSSENSTDNYDKLRLHHNRAEFKNKRLTEMETEILEELEKTQFDLEKHDKMSFMEHRLKLSFRKAVKHAIKEAEEVGDPGLMLKLYSLYEQVEKYDKKAEDPVPFSPLVVKDERSPQEEDLGSYSPRSTTSKKLSGSNRNLVSTSPRSPAKKSFETKSPNSSTSSTFSCDDSSSDESAAASSPRTRTKALAKSSSRYSSFLPKKTKSSYYIDDGSVSSTCEMSDDES